MYREPEPKQRVGENTLAFIERRKQWAHDRLEAGKAVAPYYHSKLSSVEVTGKDGKGIEHVQHMEVVFVDSKRSL
jgi:hypothetical protein